MPGGRFYKVGRKKSLREQNLERKIDDRVKKGLQMDAEWKHHTVNSNGTAATTGTILDVSAITQGNADTQRDGDEVTANSLLLRYSMGNGDTTNILRLIVFQWVPATVPTVANILVLGGATYDALSMYNTDNAQQFKILFDRQYALNNTGGGTPEVKTAVQKIYLTRRKMKFNAASTTASNKVYLLWISDSAAPTHPAYIVVSKLNFRE